MSLMIPANRALTDSVGLSTLRFYMKQVIAIVLMLLASSGTGRAVVLCARLMCPEQASACCCQDMGREEKPMMAMPMSCDDPASARPVPEVKSALTPCCTVSSPPEQPISNVPKLSADTLGTEHENQAPASVLILPKFPPGQRLFSISTETFCPDRSDTYLHLATLRI